MRQNVETENTRDHIVTSQPIESCENLEPNSAESDFTTEPFIPCENNVIPELTAQCFVSEARQFTGSVSSEHASNGHSSRIRHEEEGQHASSGHLAYGGASSQQSDTEAAM